MNDYISLYLFLTSGSMCGPFYYWLTATSGFLDDRESVGCDLVYNELYRAPSNPQAKEEIHPDLHDLKKLHFIG